MRTPLAFAFGALAASLVAAAAFSGVGQPLDSTFTYQGQLRNAGQLVNGTVDVRFTLWDSDVGGTQIGNANSFTNYRSSHRRIQWISMDGRWKFRYS